MNKDPCVPVLFYLAALLSGGPFFCEAPPRALKFLKLLSFENDNPSNPDVLAGGCGTALSAFLEFGL